MSRDVLRCDPEKIEAVKKWNVPTSVKAVRKFLGFDGYYRRFVPNFTAIAEPLNNLMKKTVTFHWDSTHQLAFDTLREKLTSALVLAFPRGDLEYIVDCDASNYGVGGVLSQVQDGEKRLLHTTAMHSGRVSENTALPRKKYWL